MRRVPCAAAVLLLWLAVLTFAFHGCGRLGCRSWATRRGSAEFVSFPRRMLIAVASLDATTSSSTTTEQKPKHHHHQHHHHHHHHSRSGGHQQHWNWEGIPPAAGPGEGADPRYGVEKRIVPTGPNPLHH